MTGIFKFLDRSKGGVLSRLSQEQRERIARNAAAAAEKLKERGNSLTEVQDIRRRNGENPPGIKAGPQSTETATPAR